MTMPELETQQLAKRTIAKRNAESANRLLTWLDICAQRLGHFSDEQERELIELRRTCASPLKERQPRQSAVLSGK